VLFFLALSVFTFWYGRRSAALRKEGDRAGELNKPELGPGIPRPRDLADTIVHLTSEEKGELDRMRAAELSGTPISTAELSSERAELQALREIGNAPVEKG